MAVVFTALGTKYTYPTSLKDITFEQFLSYLERVLPAEPKLLKDIKHSHEEEAILGLELTRLTKRDNRPTKDNERIEEIEQEISDIKRTREERIQAMNQLDHATHLLPYYARVVAHFTGMSYKVVMGIEGEGMRKDYVEALYWIIQQALEIREDQYQYVDKFELDGDVYYLPSRFMENGTVIEFMESAQFQSAAGEIRHGHYLSMIEVVSVLAKKKDEKYSSAVFSRNKQNFGRLPMDTITNIAFFLMRRSNVLGTSSQIYTIAQRLSSLKQEFKTSRVPTDGTSLSKKLLMQGYLPFRPTMHSSQLN